MDFKSYFSGWRLEHFTGWEEKSSPLYGTADIKQGISLIDAPTNPSLGRGCLWAEFRDPDTRTKTTLNELWLGAFFYAGTVSNATAFTDTNNPVMVVHSSNTGRGICLVSAAARDGSYSDASHWKVFLASNIHDKTTYVDTQIFIEKCASAAKVADCGLYFHIENGGTKHGAITVVGLTPTSMNFMGSWAGDLTDFSDFHAVSFHSGGQMTQGSYVDIRPLWLCVANSNINYSVMDLDVGSTLGSVNDWKGTTSSFPIYPIAIANPNGLYSNASAQTVTFKYGTAIAARDGYSIGAVFTSVSANTDSGMTDADVDGIIYDAVNKRTAVQGKPVPVGPDGTAAMWTYVKDPISGNHWTPDLVNAYEYGTQRTT